MQSRVYSLCVAIDRECNNRWDLINSDSLYKLDEYIRSNFASSKEVREKFDTDIGEFALVNMEKIKEIDRRNNCNRMGHIVIVERVVEDDKDIVVRPIKVIYKGDTFPKRRQCIKLIRDSLQDDAKLRNLREKKGFLLSENERDLIFLYFKYHRKKYKDDAIGFFTNRIRDGSPARAYYYCRMLTNMCGLIEENEKVVEETPKEEALKEEPQYVEPEAEQTMMDLDKLLMKKK